MKNVSITTGAHQQNGVQVRMISILDKQFIFSDKRGHSHSKAIDIEFAKQIIAEVPAKHYYADRLPVSHNVTLSWDYLEGGLIELRIHGHAGHIYTSIAQ